MTITPIKDMRNRQKLYGTGVYHINFPKKFLYKFPKKFLYKFPKNFCKILALPLSLFDIQPPTHDLSDTSPSPAYYPDMSTRPWLSALTPESRDKILTMVENGHSLKVACNRERVPYATLSKAFQYAEAALAHPDFDPVDFTPDENEIIAFYQSILAAQARCQDRLLTKIRDADDWKAALRLLQKVNAEDYAEPSTSKKAAQAQGSASASSVGTDNPLLSPRINLKLLTFEELQQLEALIRKATPTDDPPDKIVVPHRPAPATQRNKNL